MTSREQKTTLHGAKNDINEQKMTLGAKNDMPGAKNDTWGQKITLRRTK